jgi:hypothetical protein
MNRKVILERDDPRRLSATTGPIPPPPTAESIAEKRSRVSIEDITHQNSKGTTNKLLFHLTN